MNKITNKQLKVFDAIKSYIDEHNYPPTTRELCKILGFASTSTIYSYLRRLQRHGLIDWEENQSRTIIIIKEVPS